MATDAMAPTWNRLALLAGVLGLLALVFWLVAGPLALVTGYLALVQINHAEGRHRGVYLALGGMILGGLACVAQVVWFFAIVIAGTQPYHARTLDVNHLRQIGQALNFFHDENGKGYPNAVSPRGTLHADERLSWMVLILPYLEKRPNAAARYLDLAAQTDLTAGYAAAGNAGVRIPLRIYQSPSAPEPLAHPEATTYLGLTGLGEGSLRLHKDEPDAGFFGFPRTLRRDDLIAGTGFTLAVTESTRGGPWAQGGTGTAAWVSSSETDLFGQGRPFGGLHREGFHLLFADSSVSFRKMDMPADLFRRLSTINRSD